MFNSAANKIKETSASSSSSKIVETPKIKEEEEEQPKTNGDNPLNKKSFYYSRFTKVCFFI